MQKKACTGIRAQLPKVTTYVSGALEDVKFPAPRLMLLPGPSPLDGSRFALCHTSPPELPSIRLQCSNRAYHKEAWASIPREERPGSKETTGKRKRATRKKQGITENSKGKGRDDVNKRGHRRRRPEPDAGGYVQMALRDYLK